MADIFFFFAGGPGGGGGFSHEDDSVPMGVVDELTMQSDMEFVEVMEKGLTSTLTQRNHQWIAKDELEPGLPDVRRSVHFKVIGSVEEAMARLVL